MTNEQGKLALATSKNIKVMRRRPWRLTAIHASPTGNYVAPLAVCQEPLMGSRGFRKR